MWGYTVAFVSATLTVLALLGALPLLAACWQYALIGRSPRHCHLDRTEPYLPCVAVLIPAWNGGAVLDASVRRLLALDYPRDRLRVYVVDDASTDATPDIARKLKSEYPASVRHLRREQGGQGKAHTLNHGLAVIAEEDWARAVLITDADVIFTPLSLRRMTRHLADPSIGAVTAYIREGTQDKNYLNRFIAYEYATAQAAARRSQNVAGALACLAGGAQLHTMDNITALGGAIRYRRMSRCPASRPAPGAPPTASRQHPWPRLGVPRFLPARQQPARPDQATPWVRACSISWSATSRSTPSPRAALDGLGIPVLFRWPSRATV